MWGSNKLKKVARSPLAAEAMAMLEAVEDDIFGKGKAKLPITVGTDSQHVDHAIQSINITKDKRSMIDWVALRQGVEQGLFSVARQAEAGMLTAPLIKKGVSAESLREVLETGQSKVSF